MAIFQISTIPIKSIVVYSDCAFVKRNLNLDLAKGLNECILEGLSKLVDENSINIDGKGNGVKIESIQFLEIEKSNEKEESAKGNVDGEILIVKAAKMKDKIEFNKRMCVNLVKIVESRNFSANVDEEKTNFDEEIRSVEAKYKYCEDKLAELLEKRSTMELELKTLEREIQNCAKIDSQKKNKIIEKERKIHILLSAKQEGNLEIEIGYQITQANWSPHYEFCINQGNEGKGKVEVNCFGNLHQNTGENWKDAKLILSTGTSMKGNATNFGMEMPKVEMLKAELIQKINRNPPVHNFGVPIHQRPTTTTTSLFGQTSGATLFGSAIQQQSTNNNGNDEWENLDECIQQPVAIVKEFTIGTTFTVENAITILSSPNSSTKLNIASMEMDCELIYECIPSKIMNVFLSAKIVNSANHPLPGGTYSIRMEGNLNSSKNLKLDTIGIGESFLVPICIYSGIKIGYKIEQKNSEKKHPLFENGTASSLVTYLHSIELKNLKADQILLTIYQPIPKPIDEEIKIKLISPEIDQIMPKENKSGEEMSKVGIWMDPEKQILKWTMELKGKEEKKFRIQYELEYPIDKRIRIAQN